MNQPRPNAKEAKSSPNDPLWTQKGRFMRSVWLIATKAYRGAHFATFPEKLIETPLKAGCPPGGIVLDPFAGAGTTFLAARRLNLNFIGIEISPEYIKLAENRLKAAHCQQELF